LGVRRRFRWVQIISQWSYRTMQLIYFLKLMLDVWKFFRGRNFSFSWNHICFIQIDRWKSSIHVFLHTILPFLFIASPFVASWCTWLNHLVLGHLIPLLSVNFLDILFIWQSRCHCFSSNC
jgi:hypothetical protein